MSVAKIIEMVSCSNKSFDHAIKSAIEKAGKTVRNITGARILEKNIKIRNNEIKEYRVNMKIAFGVEEKKK